MFLRVFVTTAFLAVATALQVDASSLVILNTGRSAVTCGLTEGPAMRSQSVQAGATVATAATSAGIQSAKCGSLSFPNLNVSPTSGDRVLELNGEQTRTLSASLFPYIPSPGGKFDMLIEMLVSQYQSLYPDVALNLVISQDVDPYDFTSYPTIFGANGLDTLEVDTSVLQYLVSSGYVAAFPIVGDAPLPVALAAVTARTTGIVYGVPTWLCRDFMFSYDSGVLGVKDYSTLTAYLGSRQSYRIGAVYTGHWTMLGLYVNGMVSNYGYSQETLDRALSGTAAIDSTVAGQLAAIDQFCRKPGASGNPCVDRTYETNDGKLEKDFAGGAISTDVGYSERSFQIQADKASPFPYVVPMPYGPSPVPLMYVDALVRNAARCASDPCATDASNFAKYMNGASVREEIAFTADVPGSAPRHLLPAISTFYDLASVKADPLYSTVIPMFAQMRPSPTSITPAILKDVSGRLCSALQGAVTGYNCPTPSP